VSTNLELEQCFPGLMGGGYKLTSPKDEAYNCVAWAVGDTSHFWYDVRIKGYYWPQGVGSADTIEGWKRAFAIHGYTDCTSRDLEPDLEKIAIYVDIDGVPNHVARQTGSGRWTSKLGKSCDIEHETLEALEGDEYGTVGVIMQRPCTDGKRVREAA